LQLQRQLQVLVLTELAADMLPRLTGVTARGKLLQEGLMAPLVLLQGRSMAVGSCSWPGAVTCALIVTLQTSSAGAPDMRMTQYVLLNSSLSLSRRVVAAASPAGNVNEAAVCPEMPAMLACTT
jgi:hypothetical protein